MMLTLQLWSVPPAASVVLSLLIWFADGSHASTAALRFHIPPKGDDDLLFLYPNVQL
jgi:hypothetical protein